MNEENKTQLDKDKIIGTVQKLLDFMNIECQIEAKDGSVDDRGERALIVSVHTPDSARFLIGRNGQNLHALEHIVRAMAVKENSEGTVVLDVNDYRKSRTEYLVDVAKQTVTRVRNTQKAEALFPMSAYERRIVHMELAAYPDIATESVGSEPQRRVIIKPL